MIHLMKSAIQSAGLRNTSTPFNFGASGITMSGNAVVGGTLAVTGALTLSGAVALAAALTLSDVNIVLGTATGTKIGTATSQKLGFFNATPVVQPTALTAAKPAFTIADAEGTPDEAIQAVTQTTPFGFVNAAELITFLYKVQNLHTRMGEVEAKLEALGLVAAN